EDGYLEILLETDGGAAAIEASGAVLTDWPRLVECDTLLSGGFEPGNRASGGPGLALCFLRDGRIMLWNGDGDLVPGFPLSVGDDPAGSPLLVDLEGDGQLELFACDPSGFVCGWRTSASPPGGWATWLATGLENCWWPEDLPPLPGQSGGSCFLEDGSFFVYPNPVLDGSATIRFIPVADCGYEIRAFNMAGELVSESQGAAAGGLPCEVGWDASDLASGVYFVTLEIENSSGRGTELFHAAVVD
ncbi:T9SS type A sorting domain-containing protein, partial [Candidatus Fermentibacterales bacterium]|nr:T9SS type A sorting domain-containing protein [Candidatus Fermentibacterales bacterium]